MQTQMRPVDISAAPQRRMVGWFQVVSSESLVSKRTIRPTRLNAGALGGISDVSRCRAVGKGAYMKPTVKTSTTPIFLWLVVLRFQTICIGITRIMISVKVLQTPLASRSHGTLMHVPGTVLFHIRSLGVHSQILTNVVAR